LSQRAVAEMIGVTHPTVAKLIRRWRTTHEDDLNDVGAAA
jgi:transposase